MDTGTRAFGASRRYDSAIKLAEELALLLHSPAVVYHRPLDDQWFVRGADDPPPQGHTIKTVVHSGKPDTG